MKHPYSATFFYTPLLCIVLMFCARMGYGTTITSVSSGDWNNTATWDCACLPDSADAVVITASYTVTLTASDTIRAVTIDLNGVLNNTTGITLNFKEISPGAGTTFTINGEYTGAGTTKWLTHTDATTTIIAGTGTVSTSGLWTITSASAGATIQAGSDLTFSNSSASNRITLSAAIMYYFGNLTLVTGNISMSGKIAQVESSGKLVITAGNLAMGSAGTVHNYGEVTVGGNITGTGTTNKWYNYDNSSLTVAGSFLYSGSSKGYLYADYPGNTVNYNGSADQEVKYTYSASGIHYWNLKCSNKGVKMITSMFSIFLTIKGDLTIQDSARFYFNESGGDAIYLSGNWISTSTNTDPFPELGMSVTFQGTSPQSISSTVAGGETFPLLIIDGAGVTLNNCNVKVSNSLYLTAGLINTGSYEVNVTNSSTIAVTIAGGSYINGNLKRRIDRTGGSYDFPVGNANAYELATVNFTAAHTVDSLLVNFSNPASSINGLTLSDVTGYDYINVLNCGGTAHGAGNANDGVWTMTPNTGTAAYDITLNGNNYDNQQAAHTVLKRTDAASAWTLEGTYQYSNLTEPIVAGRTGLSGFSQFAIGASANALPIELLDFKALPKDDKVELFWTTATETNNDYFTVERASATPSVLRTSPPFGGETSGINFIPVGIVKGAGNSSVPINYQHTDPLPTANCQLPTACFLYYRLKQTDYDGKYSYSNIVAVTLPNDLSFEIYPNPATDHVILKIPAKEEAKSILVIDIFGRTIINKIEDMKKGVNSFTLDLSGLSNGVYLLQTMTASGHEQQKKFMIHKQ